MASAGYQYVRESTNRLGLTLNDETVLTFPARESGMYYTRVVSDTCLDASKITYCTGTILSQGERKYEYTYIFGMCVRYDP